MNDKDKIDETLDELKRDKKKKKVEAISSLLDNVQVKKETIEPEIDILKVTFENPQIITEVIDEEIINTIKTYVDNTNIPQVGVRDTYLPYVLTRVKICGNNTDARKLITSGRVKIDNKVMKLTYVTKQLSNFLLEVDGKKWEIFKVD